MSLRSISSALSFSPLTWYCRLSSYITAKFCCISHFHGNHLQGLSLYSGLKQKPMMTCPKQLSSSDGPGWVWETSFWLLVVESELQCVTAPAFLKRCFASAAGAESWNSLCADRKKETLKSLDEGWRITFLATFMHLKKNKNKEREIGVWCTLRCLPQRLHISAILCSPWWWFWFRQESAFVLISTRVLE